MSWIVEIASHAQKELAGLPRSERKRVEAVLLQMREDPFRGDVRKLQGVERTYRRRVGSYRILFDLDSAVRVVTVFRIARRTSTTY